MSVYNFSADLKQIAEELRQSHRTSSPLVADVLREAILRGALKGGQLLPQAEIAAQLGVSRIPVREAMYQLEGEGWITTRPHRGALVAELTFAELQEICELRTLLETALLRAAMPHLTGELLNEAEAILDGIDRDSDIAAHWSTENWRFHALLYAPAHRPRFLAMSKTLHDNADRYLRMYRQALLKYIDQGQSEHRRLLSACRQQDSALASTLLAEHIAGVEDLLANYLM
jgi:DNA-binding GntR family transcriptional regulator